MIDANPDSPSCGKAKMLYKHRYRFSIIKEEAIPVIREKVSRAYEGQAL